jgi:hypothetical protein
VMPDKGDCGDTCRRSKCKRRLNESGVWAYSLVLANVYLELAFVAMNDYSI